MYQPVDSGCLLAVRSPSCCLNLRWDSNALIVACCLAQIIDFNFESGIVDLTVGEAAVGSVELAFLDPKTNSPKPEGATKPSVIMRHLTTQPGRVYSLRQAKQDIDSIYSTGLFEDVNIVPQEAEDSTEQQPKVMLGSYRFCIMKKAVCCCVLHTPATRSDRHTVINRNVCSVLQCAALHREAPASDYQLELLHSLRATKPHIS